MMSTPKIRPRVCKRLDEAWGHQDTVDQFGRRVLLGSICREKADQLPRDLDWNPAHEGARWLSPHRSKRVQPEDSVLKCRHHLRREARSKCRQSAVGAVDAKELLAVPFEKGKELGV